ncbi:hypothetical protein EJ06DRAFT_521320 [Trichodelitschia bisporula]|uniref:Uncharacterized protein n=1 Tax=Trichodelitschia bisporula TaxID=703511 RepID=A0A6G1I069_9PEZI|nr:hypothetical protein EJ06DRAFT_521320 [Trichodelitschia bisporula]
MPPKEVSSKKRPLLTEKPTSAKVPKVKAKTVPAELDAAASTGQLTTVAPTPVIPLAQPTNNHFINSLQTGLPSSKFQGLSTRPFWSLNIAHQQTMQLRRVKSCRQQAASASLGLKLRMEDGKVVLTTVSHLFVPHLDPGKLKKCGAIIWGALADLVLHARTPYQIPIGTEVAVIEEGELRTVGHLSTWYDRPAKRTPCPAGYNRDLALLHVYGEESCGVRK